MIHVTAILICMALGAGTDGAFTDVQIDKPFERYLLANPLLMESAGAKVIRLGKGHVVVLAVASTALKDDTARDRLRAERVCRAKAFAYLVQEKEGLRVFHAEESVEKTVVVNEDGQERGSSVSEFLEITKTKVEGIAKDMPVIGRWKSKDGDVYYMAIGAICDKKGNPVVPTTDKGR